MTDYKFFDKNSKVDENGEHADLGVYEASRITDADSYNDNWDLVRYTSELRNKKDNSFFAFIDFHENEGTLRICPHCLEYDLHHILKPRILKNGEQRPPDYDNFIQCWECGNIYPIYQSYPETEIKDSEETVKDPSENEAVFMSTRKKKYKDRRLKNKYLDDDPDIAAEEKKGNNVRIIKDY